MDFLSDHSKRIYKYGYRDAMKYFTKISME